MSNQATRYRFADLALDTGRRRLARGDRALHLGRLTYEMLLALVEAAPNVVSHDRLNELVWGGRAATPETLAQRVKLLRRALDDDPAQPRYIEVVRGQGCRLIPAVELESVTSAEAAEPRNPVRGPASWRARRWLVAGMPLLASALVALSWWTASDRPPSALAPGEVKAAGAVKSIAVLPFLDLSERQDQQFLSDGITDDILDRLANRRGTLRVIARTSSFAFRDRPMDVTEIAARLKVSHVLEGSVRRSGERLRVTAQLVNGSDGAHVWSQTYDRTIDDLFTVQDDIASRVSAALHVALSSERGSERRPASVKAHDDYLHAKYLHGRRAPGDPELAVRYFESAVAHDPAYAQAWAGLAGAYTVMWLEAGQDAREWRRKQGEAAHKAVELDPDMLDARLRLASYYFHTSRRAQMIEQRKAAIALDPNLAEQDPAVWHDELESTVAGYREAVEDDPYSALAHLNLGLVLFATGRLDEAASELRKVLEISPNAGWDWEIEFARVLIAQGRHAEAYAAVMRLAPEGRDYGLALLHGAPGMKQQAEAALARLQARPGDKMHAIRLAEALCMRRRYQEAIDTLYRARDALERDESILSRIWFFQNELIVSPFLGPLHSDRRWQELIDVPAGNSAEEIIDGLWPSAPMTAHNRPL